MKDDASRPRQTWLAIAALLLGAWALYLFFLLPRAPVGGELPPPLLTPPVPVAAADYGWVLHDLEDRPVPLAKYQGRAIFLNVWATWCGPCRIELPSITKLAANPRLKDVVFLCVSTDDSAAIVKEFMGGKNWPMTVLRAEDKPAVFQTEGIPATFLIAPDGQIAAVDVGAAQWDDPSVVALLERLVKQAPGEGAADGSQNR